MTLKVLDDSYRQSSIMDKIFIIGLAATVLALAWWGIVSFLADQTPPDLPAIYEAQIEEGIERLEDLEIGVECFKVNNELWQCQKIKEE